MRACNSTGIYVLVVLESWWLFAHGNSLHALAANGEVARYDHLILHGRLVDRWVNLRDFLCANHPVLRRACHAHVRRSSLILLVRRRYLFRVRGALMNLKGWRASRVRCERFLSRICSDCSCIIQMLILLLLLLLHKAIVSVVILSSVWAKPRRVYQNVLVWTDASIATNLFSVTSCHLAWWALLDPGIPQMRGCLFLATCFSFHIDFRKCIWEWFSWLVWCSRVFKKQQCP